MNPDDKALRQQEIKRAHEARQLLEHPVFVDAWDQLIESLKSGWLETATGETERREMIYAQIRAAEAFRANLETVLETGRLAQVQLEEEK